MESRFGEESIGFSDPSGLVFELVANDRDGRKPWTGSGVAAEAAIRGLHSVTLIIQSPARTLELMINLLGFEKVDEMEGRIRLAVNGDEPGKTIEIVRAPDAAPATNGLGTVHHVAMYGRRRAVAPQRTPATRLQVTEISTGSTQSIYFGNQGVLFEAAVQPGFTVDEIPSLAAIWLPGGAEPIDDRGRPRIRCAPLRGVFHKRIPALTRP